MLRQLGSLRLSLAAKCELLFGAAVVLVILAAVLIPWLRMEELTQKLNEQTAEALISNALDEHVAYWRQQYGDPEDEGFGFVVPSTFPTAPATAPTTAPADLERMQYGPARLLLLAELANGSALARRSAIEAERNGRAYSRLVHEDDGGYRYRFGRALELENRCVDCHQADAKAPEAMSLPIGTLGIATVEFPSQIDRNELLLNRMFILLAALSAGTLAVLFFYLIISRLILQPVRVLQETAERVSEGDLNIRTHIPSGDEFQVLSHTFNRMLENLKEGEDQLRAINKTLDLKLAELSESNLALYESNRLKSEFLANVSHELRTPLNSILGFAELLSDNAKNDAKAARFVQNIMTSGKSLLELINDLLDLAKIEAGKMEVRAAELSIADMFEGLSSVLRPLLEQKNLGIRTHIGNDVPLMHTDAAKLQQILYNFLSNAIKFSPAGGQIDLSAVRQGPNYVRISVTDRGPGIAPDKHGAIFEKFRQIDASHTRQYGGSGLGLAISRDLTQLLGGTIGVSSEMGKGSTFWVELPIRIAAAIADLPGMNGQQAGA